MGGVQSYCASRAVPEGRLPGALAAAWYLRADPLPASPAAPQPLSPGSWMEFPVRPAVGARPARPEPRLVRSRGSRGLGARSPRSVPAAHGGRRGPRGVLPAHSAPPRPAAAGPARRGMGRAERPADCEAGAAAASGPPGDRRRGGGGCTRRTVSLPRPVLRAGRPGRGSPASRQEAAAVTPAARPGRLEGGGERGELGPIPALKAAWPRPATPAPPAARGAPAASAPEPQTQVSATLCCGARGVGPSSAPRGPGVRAGGTGRPRMGAVGRPPARESGQGAGWARRRPGRSLGAGAAPTALPVSRCPTRFCPPRLCAAAGRGRAGRADCAGPV